MHINPTLIVLMRYLTSIISPRTNCQNYNFLERWKKKKKEKENKVNNNMYLIVMPNDMITI